MKLIYFYTRNAGPCFLQNEIVDSIEKESKGKIEVNRINFEENRELIKSYSIKEIPSIIIESNGKEIARFSGLTQELFIKRAIERNSN